MKEIVDGLVDLAAMFFGFAELLVRCVMLTICIVTVFPFIMFMDANVEGFLHPILWKRLYV